MNDELYTSSATRVKAFRERLDSQFKRVEAYVTEEEKARIQAVRSQEQVTADVAVAGLIRLGLERYAELQSFAATSSVLAENAETSTFASSALTGAVVQPAVLESSLQYASKLAAPVTASPLENPVARFFKNRKEIVNG